ncbi:hypothetical protein GJ496_011882 [Pomphorhynchus laevis]|nr:hypothetical protein GJ496_011882 [Pomphorhynchus laevis]
MCESARKKATCLSCWFKDPEIVVYEASVSTTKAFEIASTFVVDRKIRHINESCDFLRKIGNPEGVIQKQAQSPF